MHSMLNWICHIPNFYLSCASVSLKFWCRRDINNTMSQCLIPDINFVISFLYWKQTILLKTAHSWNPPTFDNYFCWYCGHEIWDKHKNKLIRESYWFIFKRLQNNITCPICKKHLDKQHQTVTLSEIVIFGIKKSWVKFIIGTKSKHY